MGVAPEILVTLADGTQKEIRYVTFDDQLLVWNFYTGQYDVVPASLLVYHEQDGIVDKIKLSFNDGTTITVMNEYGFFRAGTNSFVFLNADNAMEYMGEGFLKQNEEAFETVTLVNVEITYEACESYSILADGLYNCFLEGLLSLTPPVIEGNFFMPFELGDDMKYDADQMNADIEKNGLYIYEDVADYMTEETFVALNGQYFKVAVEKGIVSFDNLMALIQQFFGN